MSFAIRSSTFHAARILRVAALSAAAMASAAQAQSPIPVLSADNSITAEQLDTAVAAVEARDDLNEDTRTRIVDQLRDAGAQLENRRSAEAAAAAYANAMQTAPAEIEELRRRLDAESKTSPRVQDLDIDAGTPLAELEQLMARESATLSGAEARVTELEAQIQAEEARPEAARARIAALRSSRDALTTVISAPPPAGESPLLTEARRLAAALSQAAQTAELRRLEEELLSYDVRLSLLKVRRDVAARTVEEQRARLNRLVSRVNESRQAAASDALQEAALAEMAAAGKHPVLREVAEGNLALTRELAAISADIEHVSGDLSDVDKMARTLENSFERSKQRLEIGGVSQVIGRLMVEERRNLPQVSQYRSEVRDRRKTLATIGLAQVRIEEQRRELTPLSDKIAELMAVTGADIDDPAQFQTTERELGELLGDRRTLLNQASSTYTNYLRALGDLDVAQRKLLDTATQYKDFLDGNLLWIPSAALISVKTLQDAAPASAWALSPASWYSLLRSIAEGLTDNLPVVIPVLLLIGLAMVTRRPLSRRIADINRRIGDLKQDNIGLTLAALGISALRALPMPALLAFLGWIIDRSPLVTDFSTSVSWALAVVAPFLYNTLLFRVLCARNGVMQVHFGWSEHNLPILRRQFDKLTVIAAPLVFFMAMLYTSPVPAHREGLARLLFIVVLFVFAGIARALAQPDKGVAANYYRQFPDGWSSKLQWLWYWLAVGLPILLAFASAAGYLYTATILTGRLIDTFWLVIATIVVNLVVLRWLALAKRKMAWQLAKKEREERLASGPPAAEGGEEAPAVERKPLDLDTVDQQTRRLLQWGLIFVAVLACWGIWSQVLPALGVLEKVALWSQTVQIDGEDTIVPVTLADMLFAVFVTIVTTIAAKNLPGLMEIAVLQHLELQPGSRYAINTLVRYVVVTIGAVVVLNVIGWKWSQIQWLVAALSVGLGFGLQEIVANFVSGLVILFERPVRVGDTVTVGELTGTVSRVRIRATTITDWDRKEIIVPNKSFITEQVINWTLSDPITRIVIPVGISYGSDVQLAHRVMRETLGRLPLVLDDPPPNVYFVGFGESSLDFKLYMYSRQLSDRLPLTHAVHEEILAALRQNGIEIPFPQRDLHLRSVDAGIRMPDRNGKDDDQQ